MFFALILSLNRTRFCKVTGNFLLLRKNKNIGHHIVIKYLKNIFVVLSLSVLILSCEDPNQSRIPYTPVRLDLNLTAQYPTFTNVYDTLVFTAPRFGYVGQDYIGYGGILVTVGIGNNGSQYYAYDLCCPYEVDAKIRVYPDPTGRYAVCKVCGSEFYIADGWGRVSKGPSKWSLKRYTASKYING